MENPTTESDSKTIKYSHNGLIILNEDELLVRKRLLVRMRIAVVVLSVLAITFLSLGLGCLVVPSLRIFCYVMVCLGFFAVVASTLLMAICCTVLNAINEAHSYEPKSLERMQHIPYPRQPRRNPFNDDQGDSSMSAPYPPVVSGKGFQLLPNAPAGMPNPELFKDV